MDQIVAGAREVAAAVPRRVSVQGLIVNYRGIEAPRFLLVRRDYLGGPAAWGPPGGGVRPDETPKDALYRALNDKLGYRVLTAQPLSVDFVPAEGGSAEQYTFAYMTTVDPRSSMSLSAGYVECRWVTYEESREILQGHGLRHFGLSVEAQHNGFKELARGREAGFSR
ncbi:NUDIX hydrolase [Kitasatospora purpeofusca]|uniref:NUDIX hydrolase n=1 Tax=Kitasatospora purpeofusca TaxID=67352 RepID=UPI0036BB7BC3